MRVVRRALAAAAVAGFTAAGIAAPIVTAAPAAPVAMHYFGHPAAPATFYHG
jgi:hypothetical protein